MNMVEWTLATAFISFLYVTQEQMMSHLAGSGEGWASQQMFIFGPYLHRFKDTWNLMSAPDYFIWWSNGKRSLHSKSRKESVNRGPKLQMYKRLPLPWTSNLPMLLILKPNCVDLGLQGKQSFTGEMFGSQGSCLLQVWTKGRNNEHFHSFPFKVLLIMELRGPLKIIPIGQLSKTFSGIQSIRPTPVEFHLEEIPRILPPWRPQDPENKSKERKEKERLRKKRLTDSNG